MVLFDKEDDKLYEEDKVDISAHWQVANVRNTSTAFKNQASAYFENGEGDVEGRTQQGGALLDLLDSECS